MTDSNNMVAENPKLKVAELVKAKRGSQARIARKAPASISHVSRVVAGHRPATARIRRAASEVFRVPQRDLVFPMDGKTA